MRCIGKAASTNAKRKQCDVSGREMITTNVNQQQPDLRPARCFASKVQLRGLQIRSPAVVGAREGGGLTGNAVSATDCSSPLSHCAGRCTGLGCKAAIQYTLLLRVRMFESRWQAVVRSICEKRNLKHPAATPAALTSSSRCSSAEHKQQRGNAR